MAGCSGAPKKAPATATQSVGTSGGSLTLGSVTLTVPAGALSSTQQITMTQAAATAPSGYTGLSPLYQFGPDGLVFQQPVTVSLPFTSPATDPTIYWSNSSGGYDEMTTTIVGTKATAQIAHFSHGFVGEKHHTAPATAKAITAFSFPALSATGTINEDTKTIGVTVPAATDVTALVATFTTTGASVAVGNTTQVSGTTANDFSSTNLARATRVER